MNLLLDMYLSLSARARAGRQWPEIGFSDHPASLLAQLLGVSLTQRLSPTDERRLIQRSQWFDECCRDFFLRHPQAMCIELGAGLSTRFHRLSDTADWPRFHWVEVDVPEVTALKQKVLPAIDNFRLVSANIVCDDWLSMSGWNSQQPLLVLLEAVTPGLKRDSLLILIKKLKQRLGATELEIVLDETRPGLWQGWLACLAKWANLRLRLPLTHDKAELEQQGFKITQIKSLLGNGSVGMVLHCQGEQSR
jgi:O-methyltransferase involved in polyketide biosynthesis